MPISIEEAIAKLKGIGNKTSTRNMTSMVDHNENCHFDFELYRTCIEHTHRSKSKSACVRHNPIRLGHIERH